ncbi:MAG: UBP-type zinc finger domain-containing protein [bacterium]
MTCPHLENHAVAPTSRGCEECLKMGSTWVHLRLCLSCGHVGCCDSSPHKHASAHYRQVKHPVVASWEPQERWAWCYADEIELPVPPAALPYLRD